MFEGLRIAVIGAGRTGLASAKVLQERGAQVAVLPVPNPSHTHASNCTRRESLSTPTATAQPH